MNKNNTDIIAPVETPVNSNCGDATEDKEVGDTKGIDNNKSTPGRVCTAKQEAYARQYLVSRCKTVAYKYAYDAENMAQQTINSKACEVYKIPHVYARIMELQEEQNTRFEISTDRITQEIAKLAFTHLPGIANYNGITMTVSEFNNLTDAQRACIKKFEVVQSRQVDSNDLDRVKEVEKIKVEVYDKHAALVSLGKINGMFIEKHEIALDPIESIQVIVKQKEPEPEDNE